MLELDLIGRKIMLSDSDTRLLLARAEAASGSSVGSRDLATRLKDLGTPPLESHGHLAFSRPESRALQRLIQAQIDPFDQLHDLEQTLAELLATD